MIFDDLPSNSNEFQKEILKRFRSLRQYIYTILPEDCLLKTRNVVAVAMVTNIGIDAVKDGLLESKDICALCTEDKCCHFNVDNKKDRLLKIKMIKDSSKMQ